jgi:hypothetical protein
MQLDSGPPLQLTSEAACGPLRFGVTAVAKHAPPLFRR